MTRMMIKVDHEPTLRLLQSLIDLKLVSVIAPPEEKVIFDESWIGCISKETGEAWMKHVEG